jgi:hypothetical protein
VALAQGTKLGPYEIQSPLGAGGMGEVYRARDTRLGRDVAIKILPPQFSSDPVRKQRFEHEAKAISSLNHPHICVLHDIGHQDGVDYLVMECVVRRDPGETAGERATAARTGWEIRCTSCRRAGQGAPQGNRSPGFEAGKHHAYEVGSETAGFWLG